MDRRVTYVSEHLLPISPVCTSKRGTCGRRLGKGRAEAGFEKPSDGVIRRRGLDVPKKEALRPLLII
jgi:hypothetical protein